MGSIEDKMYLIAEHFDALNPKGKVKCFNGHEKGYARIKDIIKGCTLLVHHMKDDYLFVEIMITPNALSKYSVKCNNTIDIFVKCFGSDAKHTKWEHSIDKYKYDSYMVDVTNKALPDILSMVQDIKSKLTNS